MGSSTQADRFGGSLVIWKREGEKKNLPCAGRETERGQCMVGASCVSGRCWPRSGPAGREIQGVPASGAKLPFANWLTATAGSFLKLNASYTGIEAVRRPSNGRWFGHWTGNLFSQIFKQLWVCSNGRKNTVRPYLDSQLFAIHSNFLLL